MQIHVRGELQYRRKFILYPVKIAVQKKEKVRPFLDLTNDSDEDTLTVDESSGTPIPSRSDEEEKSIAKAKSPEKSTGKISKNLRKQQDEHFTDTYPNRPSMYKRKENKLQQRK